MDVFDGFKVLARVIFPQSGEGAFIVEAQDMAAVYKHTAPWTKTFGIIVEVTPGLSDEEFLAAEKEQNLNN